MFAALGLALLVTLTLATAAMATPYEAQGWKTQDQHIHLIGDVPMLETLSAPTTLHMTILLHNAPTNEHVSFLDAQDQGTTISKVSLNIFGDNSKEQRIPVDITVDPAKFAHSGWQELRLRANIDKPDREFPTSRICVNIQNGKSLSNYCGGPTVAGRCGAGAWYPDIASNYRIIFVDCRDQYTANARPLVPGDKVRIKSQDGDLYANIDPHFHDGDAGIPLVVKGAANKWTTVTIPAGLAPGVHKLHMRSQTGVEAGAYVMTFTTA